RLMAEHKLGAIYMESGSSMYYFTGERRAGTSVMIQASGEPVWFDGTDRTAEPKKIVQALRSRTLALGLEEQVRFRAYDSRHREASALELAIAPPVTAGCRSIKSPAEIALMKHASDVTIEAYRAALATLQEGMTQYDLAANINAAYQALGFRGNVSVSFG